MKPTGQSYELRCGHDTERFHYVFRNEYGEPSDGCRACDKLDRRSTWPRPIPVSERLPEKDERVLWWDGDDWEAGELDFCENGGRPEFDFDAGDPYYTPDYDGFVLLKDRVTHWLPMPPPVKE